MGVWDGIKHQFIEVIEWTEPSDDVLTYRFPVANNEIKQGAQLTVRESQLALFVDQGVPADEFQAGRHTLVTDNLPVLTKLKSWAYGFNSPFKSEVYFFSLRQKLGQKWGTRQPITLRDAEFGSVQLRMFGVHSYHVQDARKFYREIAGTREAFTTDDLVTQLLPTIVSAATATFAQSKLPFLDMASNLAVLSNALRSTLITPFADLGLALDSFVVESVSLPEALEQALHTRQQMSLVGDLQKFAQFQAAKSIEDAAKNPSGMAGIGAGVAAGVGLGNVMNQALSGLANPPAPPPSAAGGAATATAPSLVGCVGCGKGIESGSPFCRFCGVRQAASCPECQQPVTAGSAFCGRCGHKLGGA
jgi:membrane protease subunit (stomatin/prohibitin family)